MGIELSNSKKTYLGTVNGRKKWALDCSIGADQFREDGGEWQDIDPSIEAEDTEGFSVKFTQTPYLGRIAEDSRRRIYPDRTNLSCWIEFDKPYASMGTFTRSNRWFYWNFTNAILGIRFNNTSIKFGFRLKNSSAPTSITIPFTTQGITRQGRLLYYDGEVIAELRKPTAIDANEEERECEVVFGTGEVTISLDTTGLAFPIDIDPTLDLQVGGNLDDICEKASTGWMWETTIIVHRASASAAAQWWGGHRFVSGSLPSQGDTIDVAYAQLYIGSSSYDDIKGYWHFEETTSPAQFSTTAHDITDRVRTSASVLWNKTSMGTGWEQTASLVNPLQEVINGRSPTALVLIFRPDTVLERETRTVAHNDDPAEATKLHIEWTVAVVAPTVTTSACSNATPVTLQGNGNITDIGGENCHTRGFCYKQGTTGTPTTADDTVYDNGGGSYGTGAYSKTISGLNSNISYRVRAYAINTAGTGYGTTVTCTTLVQPYLDVITSFRTLVQVFKDVATRFRFLGTGFIDVSTSFSLSIRYYVDAAIRFRLFVQNFQDTLARFKLQLPSSFVDAIVRFKLNARSFADILSRFTLFIQNNTDIPIRFKLLASPTATTQPATDIESTSAMLWGKITDDGGATCEARFRYRVKC